MEHVQRFTYMRIVNRMLVANALIFAAASVARSVGYLNEDTFYNVLLFVAAFTIVPFFIAALERQEERTVIAEPLSDEIVATLADGFGSEVNRNGNVITFASGWDTGPLRQHMRLHLAEESDTLRIVGPRAAVSKVANMLDTFEQ